MGGEGRVEFFHPSTHPPSSDRVSAFLTAFSLALSSWGDLLTLDTDHTPDASLYHSGQLVICPRQKQSLEVLEHTGCRVLSRKVDFV